MPMLKEIVLSALLASSASAYSPAEKQTSGKYLNDYLFEPYSLPLYALAPETRRIVKAPVESGKKYSYPQRKGMIEARVAHLHNYNGMRKVFKTRRDPKRY